MRRSVLSLMALSLLGAACDSSSEKSKDSGVETPVENTDTDTDETPVETTDTDTDETPVDTTDTDTDETPVEIVDELLNAADPEGANEVGNGFIEGVDRVSYKAILLNPELYSQTSERYTTDAMIETVAKVKSSCQTRGCWMELRPEDSRAAKDVMTVRFRNYGFFVPMDSPGHFVRVQGVLLRQHLTAAEVAHYESEGATYPFKNEDGSADVYEFKANAVRLWK